MIPLRQGLLLFSLLISPFIQAVETKETKYPISSIPIFKVDTQSNDGTAIGKDLGQQIKTRFPNVENIYDRYLSQFLSQSLFDELFEMQVNVVKPNIDSVYQEEIDAIAATWELATDDELGDGLLSLNEYWLIQLMPNLGRFTQGSGFGVWGQHSELNSPIVGRNLDLFSDEGIRHLQAITVYDDGENTVVNIGFAGYVGVLTGFNQEGLFVAYFDSPLGHNYPYPKPDDQVSIFALRQVLENHTKVRKASNELIEKQYSSSHSVLLADSQKVLVLELPKNSEGRMRTDDSRLTPNLAWDKNNQLAVMNCFALKTSLFNCYNTNNLINWLQLKQLAQFNPIHPAKLDDIASMMFDKSNREQGIFNKNTLQSIVFTPQDKKLYIYTKPVTEMGRNKPIHHELVTIIPQEEVSNQVSIHWSVLLITFFVLIVLIMYGERARRRFTQ